MEGQEGQVTLSDGRRLGFVDSGPPEGSPLFYFHGFPGSRKEAGLLFGEDLAGLRVLAVDRPGMGLSDYQPNRALIDWPRDVGELADRLGMGRISILGLSGGGPYAAACARAMPDRIICAGIVCGPAELIEEEASSHLGAGNRATLKLLHSFPGLGKPSYAAFAFMLKHWPLMMLDTHFHALPRCDREVLLRPSVRRALSSSFRESVSQGSAGGAQELKILLNPWHFNPREIQVPVALWHGELDPIVPVAMGRQLARVIPRCRASFFPTESHYSLLVNHREAILGDLRKMISGESP